MITKISNEVIAEFAASSSYKERFIAEYILLKQKHEKLKAFNTKIEAAGEMAFRVGADKVPMPKHDCPEELLRRQQHVMGEYLHILEVRAVIEGIDLKEAIEALARESIRRASECCTVRASECCTVDEGEGRPCCKSDSVPPCEEGIYESSAETDILSLDETIKSLEICAGSSGCKGCALCDENEYCTDTNEYSMLKKSAVYYLKKYAGLE